MPIKRAYSNLESGQLHYRYAGDENKPVLLLLHQSPSDSQMYESLMEQLDADFYLLAPDSPGFGLSDPVAGGFTLEGASKILVGWLTSIGIDSCLVFGHHTGASVAVQLASDHPDLFISLALSGPPLMSEELKAALPGKAAPFEVQANGTHLSQMWQRMAAKEGDSPAALIERETLSAFRAGSDYLRAYERVAQQDFASQLSSINVPVLVFAGTKDILYPGLSDAYKLLQQGEIQEIEGAGSYVCDREAPRVAKLLREFYL